jgi:hypothetical protein
VERDYINTLRIPAALRNQDVNAPNADAWELAGFPGRLNFAANLTADQLAAQYRVLVDVLLDAQEQSLTGVGRDDLLIAVRECIAAATDQATAERLTDPEVDGD